MTQPFVVEVIYALPERQRIAKVTVQSGTTVGDAVEQAALQLSVDTSEDLPVGMFGQVVDAARLLQPGDRVEIYRPLAMDAKTARQLRAEQQRSAGVFTSKGTAKK